MYLKRLELQGFKSFADRTTLEFQKGITAVIGPNGSGKSNISDAIRWVLGEQSIKSLRGSKSEDIIFAGTQNRKSLGFAECSLVMSNEDGSLPIEYSEVTVTRRLYRSGETGYFINKVPCRLKDILELFMDTGIGKDGYSIIGQGKIDEILSNKSEDRRHIFEEAAGIVKFRTRREESEKKLEQTKVNLIRINDILTEIESNLEPLRLQSEKAKKFLDLREELKNIEIGLFIYKIDSFKAKLEELQKDKDIFENQELEENNKLDEMQDLKEKLKQELENINCEIERLQTLGFESKNTIEKITSNINISNERIINNSENKERTENEIRQASKNIEDLEEERKNKELKRENLKANKEKFTKELNEKQEELNKITAKMSNKEKEIENKKKTLEEQSEIKYQLQNNITAKNTTYENDENRKKILEKELINVVSELDEKRENKNILIKNFNIKEKERNDNKNKLNEIQKEKIKIDNRTKEFETIIANLTDDKRMKTSKLNFLIETEKEKEGYIKSVKELLIACDNNNELKQGISGIIANIISADEKYQTAIEQALGASLQNIVTDTEQDAKRMIEYLRKNNMGRASFLPITSVKGKKLENFKIKEGVIGIASDLVKTEKKYKGVIESLLGRTVITENIETAIKLAKENRYSFKIVTLDGDIINPSGAMTGGSIFSKKTTSLLGRTAEIKNLENKIKEIDKKLENVIGEKDEYLKENEKIISQIKEIAEQLQKSEIEYATEKEKINSAEEEIIKIENNKIKLKEEIKSLEIEMNNILEEKKTTQAEVEKCELQISKLSNEISEYAKLNKDNQKFIDDLNIDITNLKISVSSFDESNTSIDEMVERIEKDIEDEKNEIENKKKEIEKSKLQNIELMKQIEELKLSIEKITQEVSNSSEKIEQLKISKEDKNKKIDSYEENITKQFETIQGIKEQLAKIDVKTTGLNQDITETINELWNEYEVTPNNATEYKKPTNVQDTQKQVNEIHTKIKNLGSVNVDSIDEYKKTKERYENMSEQRLDLESTMSKLRDMIVEMTKTMKGQFKEKFIQINKNFNEVFIELFGGGKAELVLEDEENILECGIDIRVQPAGKKLQNMMLLSGGEKALTAISLLFAILKINPAPFCILDEIEAALDDVNVYRYAEFLKKFANNTQFLVITHRKGTMESANTVYGVTMEENGVSKLLSINLSK